MKFGIGQPMRRHEDLRLITRRGRYTDVPTIAFQQLFAFLVLRYERRRLLWFAVTGNPTAEWLARQITEAFLWDRAPKYLIRDNDQAFGVAFKARVRAMGIRDRTPRFVRPGRTDMSNA